MSRKPSGKTRGRGSGRDIEPQWLRVSEVRQVFGITKAKVYELIHGGCIVTVALKEPGRSRGTRLVCAASVRAHLESLADAQRCETDRFNAEVAR